VTSTVVGGSPLGGLLAIHAHPDDETLSTGALLATWAASGRPVSVVTCTRGERGEVIPSALAHLAEDPRALAAHREGELAGALAALGVTGHVFLDRLPGGDAPDTGVPDAGAPARFVDSGMAWVRPGHAAAPDDLPRDAFVGVPVEDAAARVAGAICSMRPDVVVGYEPGGGYGHPDHVHAHRVMRRAVELAAAGATGSAPYRVPVVLWAVLDKEARRAALTELTTVRGLAADRRLEPEPADAPGPSAEAAASEIDIRVAVEPVVHRVAAALRAYATQVQGVRTWRAGTGTSVGCFALSNRVLQPLLARECYRVDPTWPPGTLGWPGGVEAGIA
jgi:N-acetyl-1-D-myo-inositol-2-amino-2-deoxy-alpha-D-glucopyranoside deacetylase